MFVIDPTKQKRQKQNNGFIYVTLLVLFRTSIAFHTSYVLKNVRIFFLNKITLDIFDVKLPAKCRQLLNFVAKYEHKIISVKFIPS